MLVLLGLTVSQMIDFDSQQNCQTGKVQSHGWQNYLLLIVCCTFLVGLLKDFCHRVSFPVANNSGDRF